MRSSMQMHEVRKTSSSLSIVTILTPESVMPRPECWQTTSTMRSERKRIEVFVPGKVVGRISSSLG